MVIKWFSLIFMDPKKIVLNKRRLIFFTKIEEEIINANENNKGIIIECDANAKLEIDKKRKVSKT